MENNLTIQLRVLSSGIDKINSASSAVDKLNSSTKASGGGFDKFSKSLISAGSQLNVLGQRMTWMVSVPLLAFANNAINTAVEIETSWVRFRKVFSGTDADMQRLQKSATELSTRFGRPVEEINNVMAEFNKAGIDSADELEKLARIASETAIIFDTDLNSALEGTKAVMMGFNLNADQTELALAKINIIADKTTASEQGILDVFNRAAGTARQYGFSVEALAASQAAFEKNAIPAGRAGNAMKSILVSLTKQSNLAKDQFRELGIDMSSTAWRTADAQTKLEILSKRFLEIKSSGDKLKFADLNEALASLVGKFQVNNLNVLLEDMAAQFDNNADTVSQFYEGLNVASNDVDALKWKQEQLNKVLESSPQKIATLEQAYRNQSAILGAELLPYKIKLLETLTKILEKFSQLDPKTQDWIIKLGMVVAAIGPVLAFAGLFVSTLGFVGTAISTVVGWVGSMIGALSGAGSVIAGTASGVGILSTALGVGFVVALTAATAYVVTKAIKAIVSFNEELWAMQDQVAQNEQHLDTLQQKVGTLSTDQANQQLQNAIDKAREADKATQELTKRYEGLGGVLRAVGDQFVEWGNKAWDAISKVISKAKEYDKESKGKGNLWDFISKKFAYGGIVPGYAHGGLVYAANGFVPRGSDTVPAMLSPGEMVLNRNQQANLFNMIANKRQSSEGGPVININVGTMVATRGEQRYFAREIKKLLEEDNGRY